MKETDTEKMFEKENNQNEKNRTSKRIQVFNAKNVTGRSLIELWSSAAVERSYW